ncbi:MAG: hypothetical protein RR573_01455 [Oscillospiraceae bacterium]
MLGKLLKYDIKAQMKIALPSFGVALMLAGVCKVTLMLGFFESDNLWLSIPSTMLLIACVLSLFAITIIAFVCSIIYFYKNILGDEGYLMFTLPVSPTKILLSKLFSAVLWIVSSIALCVFSGIFLLGADFQMIYSSEDIGIITPLLAVILVLAMLFGIVCSIIIMYVSMSVGPHILSNRLAGSIVAYIAITFGMQVIATATLIISGIAAFNAGIVDVAASTSPYTVVLTVFSVMLVIEILLSTIGFLVTRHFLCKKLNLA